MTFLQYLSQPEHFSLLLMPIIAFITGIGFGWWAWGKTVKQLVANFDTVSNELEMLKHHSLAQKYGSDGKAEPTPEQLRKEINRLNEYARQLEADRNRTLLDMQRVQKQLPSEELLDDLQNHKTVVQERDHLWRELLDFKQKYHADQTRLADLTEQNNALQADNQQLEMAIQTQVEKLNERLLDTSDELEDAENQIIQLSSRNQELDKQSQHWKTLYERECAVADALTQQVAKQVVDEQLDTPLPSASEG